MARALGLLVLVGAVLGAEAALRGGVAGTRLQMRQEPRVFGNDISKGEMPTAGEAVGRQTGVDVPNPHKWLVAALGGGVLSLFVSLAIFCAASYYAYTWNQQMTAQGQEPNCGVMSVLCCLFCTPVVCCYPIDGNAKDTPLQ